MRETPVRPGIPTYLWIVVVCVLVDVGLHRLFGWVFAFNYFDNGLAPSVWVPRPWFPLAAVLGFLFLFGWAAWIYSQVRTQLAGPPQQAGLRFFGPLACIVFFGVLESAFVFPTPFRAEFITAVADALPYPLLSVLLARFAGPRPGERPASVPQLAPWGSMLWVAGIYVAGRYLGSYWLLGIVSGYIDRATGTLAWTAVTGLSFGAFYWLAGSGFTAKSSVRRALFIGAGLGVFWLGFQLFYALMFAVSVADLTTRGVADALYLVLGIASYERLFRRGASG